MARLPQGEVTLRLMRPHEAQRQILREARRFNVLACGRRFGKTTFVLDRLLRPALEGYPVGWFAPTYKTLAEVWRDARRFLKPITLAANSQERRIELVGGGVFEFWQLDADPESCRGRKYKRIAVDEAAKVRELQTAWEMAIGPTLMDYEGDAWFPSTPKGANYFYDLFGRGTSTEERWKDWASWQIPTSANPFIKSSELARLKLELPQETYDQEILARFIDGAGRFFAQWSEERHVQFPIDIRPEWRWSFFGGFDWGYARPSCFVLCAADQRGRVHVVEEYYDVRKEDDELAKSVVGLLAKHGLQPRDLVVYADPGMWQRVRADKRGELGRKRVESFWSAGLRFVQADNARIDGWSNLRLYLKQEQLTVFKGRAPNLCRTIPQMMHDATNVEDLDTDLEDHAVDALRYALMSRPISRRLSEEQEAKRKADQAATPSWAKRARSGKRKDFA